MALYKADAVTDRLLVIEWPLRVFNIMKLTLQLTGLALC